MKKLSLFLIAILFVSFTGLSTAQDANKTVQRPSKKVETTTNTKKVKTVKSEKKKASKCDDCKDKSTCTSKDKDKK
jgi:hypothetical protein